MLLTLAASKGSKSPKGTFICFKLGCHGLLIEIGLTPFVHMCVHDMPRSRYQPEGPALAPAPVARLSAHGQRSGMVYGGTSLQGKQRLVEVESGKPTADGPVVYRWPHKRCIMINVFDLERLSSKTEVTHRYVWLSNFPARKPANTEPLQAHPTRAAPSPNRAVTENKFSTVVEFHCDHKAWNSGSIPVSHVLTCRCSYQRCNQASGSVLNVRK